MLQLAAGSACCQSSRAHTHIHIYTHLGWVEPPAHLAAQQLLVICQQRWRDDVSAPQLLHHTQRLPAEHLLRTHTHNTPTAQDEGNSRG